MTEQKMKELADQAVRELRKEGRTFTVDRVGKEKGIWDIAFSHGKTLLKVFIDASLFKTEDVIYTEIWRQLLTQAEMIQKRPPSKRAG
jgi:hypothetical protein